MLADDDALAREAIAELFAHEPGFGPVVTCSNELDLTAHLDSNPDLILLAETLAGPNSARLFRVVAERAPLLVISRGDVEDLLLPALEAGALGVVPTTVTFPEFVHTVRAALRGEACVPRGMLGSLLRGLIDRRRRDDEAMARYGRLTAREREVLQMLVRGADLDAISSRLFVSPQTVRSHLQHVLEKLDVHSRADAVAFVLDHDLLEPALQDPL